MGKGKLYPPPMLYYWSPSPILAEWFFNGRLVGFQTRIDRRKVIACALWISTLAAFLLVFLTFLPSIWLFIFMGLWGAGALSGFAICLSHAVDHYDVDQLGAGFASLLMCWASGAAIGPALWLYDGNLGAE